MKSFVWRAATICGALLAVVVAGCGASNELNRQAVSGMVTVSGEPLANGSIQFEPTGPKGTNGGAAIKAGAYAIAAERGLPPGEYLVRINGSNESIQVNLNEAPGDSSAAVVPELIPAEYNSASSLRITVDPKIQNVHDFKIPEAAKAAK